MCEQSPMGYGCRARAEAIRFIAYETGEFCIAKNLDVETNSELEASQKMIPRER